MRQVFFYSWRRRCEMVVWWLDSKQTCASSDSARCLSQRELRSQTLFFCILLKGESLAFAHYFVYRVGKRYIWFSMDSSYIYIWPLWLSGFKLCRNSPQANQWLDLNDIGKNDVHTMKTPAKTRNGKTTIPWIVNPQISQDTRSLPVDVFPLRLWKSIANAWNARYAGVLPFW